MGATGRGMSAGNFREVDWSAPVGLAIAIGSRLAT